MVIIQIELKGLSERKWDMVDRRIHVAEACVGGGAILQQGQGRSMRGFYKGTKQDNRGENIFSVGERFLDR